MNKHAPKVKSLRPDQVHDAAGAMLYAVALLPAAGGQPDKIAIGFLQPMLLTTAGELPHILLNPTEPGILERIYATGAIRIDDASFHLEFPEHTRDSLNAQAFLCVDVRNPRIRTISGGFIDTVLFQLPDLSGE